MGLSGWLYSDLLLGLLVIFLAVGSLGLAEVASLKTEKEQLRLELEELKEGDEFYVATALAHIGTKSIIFENRFFSVFDERLLFKAKFISVFMDLNTRTSIPIPDKVKLSLAKEIPGYIDGA